ncbi:aspartic proteinase nepenthesin-2-like [Lolium rigidum]|uniref:aspartic proteinase nepenthesin-2-like n=1 Tax=Lolium rigidum TaxID=89674 RepID=UPI001F5C6154|nr:aspartic proteinase nepenthesin-2-like [Lolium rigidum]
MKQALVALALPLLLAASLYASAPADSTAAFAGDPDPLFTPGASSSYEPMRCSGQLCGEILHHACQRPDTCTYRYNYGDGTTTLGVYATERFTFSSSSGERVSALLGFGCGSMNIGSLNNGSGIVGFGRNPLSLVSQMSIRRFSYCLTPYASARKSTLMFGSLAAGVYDDANGHEAPAEHEGARRGRLRPFVRCSSRSMRTTSKPLSAVGPARIHHPNT